MAQQSDYELWSSLREKLWPTQSAEAHFDELKQLTKSGDYFGWFAYQSKECIGFAEAGIRPFANGCITAPVAFLEGIWVSKKQRNQNIGRELIKSVEKWAREKGLSEIGSDADISNTISHYCHKAWGFEETERVIYYRKNLNND